MSDWKKRLQVEEKELGLKADELRAAVYPSDNEQVSVASQLDDIDIRYMKEQLRHMDSYHACLLRRMNKLKIETLSRDK